MFTKFKKIVSEGATSHICELLGQYILIYGGSNFHNKYDRVVLNDYYIYDMDFNILKHGKGNMSPENGIRIKDENILWYILNDNVYKLYIKDLSLVEELYAKLPHSFSGGFGFVYGNDLIFGNDKVFKFNINTKKLSQLEDFIGEKRNQAVYANYDKYIYVLGGASDICYMDTYRYDISSNKWERLKDLNISLLGAASHKIDDENLLIIGGFNKEVYDKAVISLKDKDYKKIYFNIEREKFKWNKKILKYNFKTFEFTVLEENENAAVCGASLINIKDRYFLTLGEIKPGLRSMDAYVFKMEEL